MNFAELLEEFFARGTDYLEEDAAGLARAKRWINQAYKEILALQSWPFLRADGAADLTSGLTQATIEDLRRILFVTDAATGSYPGRPLKFEHYDNLVLQGVDLNLSGNPEVYYIVYGNRLSTYPLGSSIYFNYIKRAPNLLSDDDEPIFDEAYHDLIIDRAMMKAYKDSDNFDGLAALKEEYNAGLVAMTEDYMGTTRDITYINVDPYDG